MKRVVLIGTGVAILAASVALIAKNSVGKNRPNVFREGAFSPSLDTFRFLLVFILLS